MMASHTKPPSRSFCNRHKRADRERRAFAISSYISLDYRLYHVAGGGGELHLPVEGGLVMYLPAHSSITSMT